MIYLICQIDDLDHDLSDLSGVWIIEKKGITKPYPPVPVTTVKQPDINALADPYAWSLSRKPPARRSKYTAKKKKGKKNDFGHL